MLLLAGVVHPAAAQTATVTDIRYWSLGDVTRIAVEIDGEFTFTSNRLTGPERLFFDIRGAKPAMARKGVREIPVGDRMVKQIRVAETQPGVTRVVLDLEQEVQFTSSQLGRPARLMIEVRAKDPPGGPPATVKTGQAAVYRAQSLANPEQNGSSKPQPRAFRPPPLSESFEAKVTRPVQPYRMLASAAPEYVPPSKVARALPPWLPPPETVATARPPAPPVPELPVLRAASPPPVVTVPEIHTLDLALPASPPVAPPPVPLPLVRASMVAPVVNVPEPRPALAVPEGLPNLVAVQLPVIRAAMRPPEVIVPKPQARLVVPDGPPGRPTVVRLPVVRAAMRPPTVRVPPPSVSLAVPNAPPAPPAVAGLPEVGAALSPPVVRPARRASDAKAPPAPPPEVARNTPANTPANSGAPVAARKDSRGGQSLTRVLGLKLGRVVLDPGHGGHDLGTHGASGLAEKDLVLDVAKRLGALLRERSLAREVIFTRSDDTFIPLEQRTQIANEHRADLFLSIHANSSPVRSVNGAETYYLSLTTSKGALDVASRENASSERSIFELKGLLEQIALKDKVDESREFAAQVQHSLLGVSGKAARDRGVKKAPFVVLIGAEMPSVLAEIGFLTNAQEEAQLRSDSHRDKLAEALYRGIASYASTLSRAVMAQSR